jgi:hypothetical protein
MLCRCSYADALPPWLCFSVDASPSFRASCLLSLLIFGDSLSSLCRFSSSGGLCLGSRIGVPSSSVLLLLSVRCVRGYGCLFDLFFGVSLLCDLVLVKLYLATSSIVCVSAFFLMNYVPKVCS